MRPFRNAEPWRGTEPCIEIRIGVEQEPRVTVIAFSSEDEQRIRGWVAARPDLQWLVDECAGYAGGVETIQSIITRNLLGRADELEEAA